jgi:hypothetical protein
MVPVFLHLRHLLLEEVVRPLASLARELALLSDCLCHFGVEVLHDHFERVSHHNYDLVAFKVLVQKVSHGV